MLRNLEKLKRLAKFENMFQRDNLFLGLRMWLRVNVAMIVVGFALALVGILAALGMLAYSFLMAVSFFLYQWSASIEGRKLYGLAASPWCWWSVVWRLLMYMLPVIFVLLIVGGPIDLNERGEISPSDEEKLANINLITALLSIIPMGLATSQALLVSAARHSSGQGLPGDDSDEKRTSVSRREKDTDEDDPGRGPS
jgi:hypothetical protein